jgi:hypothetical protein
MPAPSSSLTAYTRDALHILQRSLALAVDGEWQPKLLPARCHPEHAVLSSITTPRPFTP